MTETPDLFDSPELPDEPCERKDHPCGCVELCWADGRQAVEPCVPCALVNAAEAMSAAAAMLEAAGARMAKERIE